MNFLGSVLYIAAHPDDENTRLISYMANHTKARTGYLSLTRGDGGQNLIGTELRELLGVVRTQELLEARKIDGGQQFFTRANDFGYSKTPDETLNKWNRDLVLSDMVYIIRKFKPDIIINRFDHRTPGTTHGHHTSSAMLAQQAFEIAADATKYPQHLALAAPWQPQRLFFNTSFWMYGGKEKFEKADKSKFYTVQTGVYFPALGKSNQEIAALSRSRHQSQGFGSTGTRGEEMEYLELISGNAPRSKSNLFEGIDTSWNRVSGASVLADQLKAVEQKFDFKNPAASIPALVEAYALLQNIEDQHWKAVKSAEIKEIIAACAGLYLEAAANEQSATPNSTIPLKLEAINRSDVNIKLQSVTVIPGNNKIDQNTVLANNQNISIDAKLQLPADISFTEPYWLRERGTEGMYTVSDPVNIGVPDVIRETKVQFNILVENVPLVFERTIVYKYNDDVKGEVYKPFDIFPDVTMSIGDKVRIFPNGSAKKVTVTVKSARDNVTGTLRLALPPTWEVSPHSAPIAIAKKGRTQLISFDVTPPSHAEDVTIKAAAIIDGKTFDKEQISINYEHISPQQVLKTAESRLIKLDIKTGNEKIAYIMGAGDEVNISLIQMGYDVQTLKAEEITAEKLQTFDVVITGIRAYNTISELSAKQSLLMDFVASGKTMIVQYNTAGDFVTKDFSPYPLRISRDRVTEEDAEVRFLQPQHRLLNHPNKITANDFKNWKQEQGLYYPDQWDPAFTAILSSNDKDEKPKDGALLVAKHGKGHYIYTGLSFFRELPEGVPGAYRLIANLISIGTK
ncbi:MAG TPA: PIG-L family deacetylase [Flavobacterium sp.]|nr:PIG-L family deacetylase [Flavobacterium sp.]